MTNGPQSVAYFIIFSTMQPQKLPLRGVRVLSLALNLPGPAALWRLKQAGASCLKLEPPSGDPMALYQPNAYAEMHSGIRRRTLDLKSTKGRTGLDRELARSDILLTSFRPSALARLGLDADSLRRKYPQLSVITIVGAPGAAAETAGHDLTYMAEHGLVQGTELPPTLFADMAGALLAVQAVYEALLLKQRSGKGVHREVALTDAAAWLAHPRQWGLTMPSGTVGGAHAGYAVYACKDGRVAVAALEPHFAQTLASVSGLKNANLMRPSARRHLAAWFAGLTRRTLDRLASEHDLPLHTLR